MRQVRIGFRDPFQDQKLQPSDSPSAIRRSTHGGQQLRRRGGAEQPVPTLWVEAALAADRRRRQPLEPSRHSISPAAKALEDRRRNHDMMRSHGVRRIGRAMPSIRLALLSSSARRRCLRITNLAWKWSWDVVESALACLERCGEGSSAERHCSLRADLYSS
jgi:hypothetical protein